MHIGYLSNFRKFLAELFLGFDPLSIASILGEFGCIWCFVPFGLVSCAAACKVTVQSGFLGIIYFGFLLLIHPGTFLDLVHWAMTLCVLVGILLFLSFVKVPCRYRLGCSLFSFFAPSLLLFYFAAVGFFLLRRMGDEGKVVMEKYDAEGDNSDTL